MNQALLTLFAIALGFLQPAPPEEPIDVWLDVDTSTGVMSENRTHDVDDGLAMIYAFNSPELNVRGVSVQFGNAALEQAVPIAEGIVEQFGPAAMPVHAGAASAEDLDKSTAATDAIIAALRKKPMHVLALGPVTNIAAVLEAEPDIADRIESIVVVAARRPGFVFGPKEAPGYFFPDANFEKDVQGMQVLLDSDVPIVFAGYEVSSHVWLSADDLAEAAEASDVGAWVAQTSQPWLDQWVNNLGTPGFNPFDTLADLWLTHPQLIEQLPVTLEIVERLDERATPEEQAVGKTKPYLIATPTEEATRHVYLTVPDPEAHDVILERLTTRPASR